MIHGIARMTVTRALYGHMLPLRLHNSQELVHDFVRKGSRTILLYFYHWLYLDLIQFSSQQQQQKHNSQKGTAIYAVPYLFTSTLANYLLRP